MVDGFEAAAADNAAYCCCEERKDGGASGPALAEEGGSFGDVEGLGMLKGALRTAAGDAEGDGGWGK